jgi:hypothetical protein
MIKNIGYLFYTTAVWNENGYYEHFGINADFASVYGNKPEDVVKVTCQVTSNKPFELRDKHNDDKQVYWGWMKDDEESCSLIYPSQAEFHVCFPYGVSVEEEAGRGKAYVLHVQEVLFCPLCLGEAVANKEYFGKQWYVTCNSIDDLCPGKNMYEDGEFGTVNTGYDTMQLAISDWKERIKRLINYFNTK